MGAQKVLTKGFLRTWQAGNAPDGVLGLLQRLVHVQAMQVYLEVVLNSRISARRTAVSATACDTYASCGFHA